MSMLETIRDAVYTAIAAKKLAELYVYNTFDLERSWYPYQSLKTLTAGTGKVWVIGLAYDDDIISRAGGAVRELPVQIAIQRAMSANDQITIGTMVTLDEQIRDTCRQLSLSTYSWNRTESLKDPNKTPFAYAGLREGNYFESYFTAYYKHPFA